MAEQLAELNKSNYKNVYSTTKKAVGEYNGKTVYRVCVEQNITQQGTRVTDSITNLGASAIMDYRCTYNYVYQNKITAGNNYYSSASDRFRAFCDEVAVYAETGTTYPTVPIKVFHTIDYIEA